MYLKECWEKSFVICVFVSTVVHLAGLSFLLLLFPFLLGIEWVLLEVAAVETADIKWLPISASAPGFPFFCYLNWILATIFRKQLRGTSPFQNRNFGFLERSDLIYTLWGIDLIFLKLYRILSLIWFLNKFNSIYY